MDKITLNNAMHNTATILPNEFIDKYMLKADGEYVKIYLLILRLTSSNVPVHIDQLADTLELTRKDILRALNYWKKVGLLSYGDAEADAAVSTGAGEQGGATMMAGEGIPAVPEKNSRSIKDMEKAISGTDLEQTIYMAETYLGRPLSSSELNSFCYISDSLGFSSELLEYLHHPGEKERPLYGDRGHQLVSAENRHRKKSAGRIQPVYAECLSGHEGFWDSQPQSGPGRT